MQKTILLFLVVVGLSACSSWSHRRQPSQVVVLKDAKGQTSSPQALPEVIDGKEVTPIQPDEEGSPGSQAAAAHASTPQAQAEAVQIKEAVAAAAQHVQKTHGEHHRESGPVPAEKSLGWLKNGNTRFVKGFFRKDGATTSDRTRLVSGQKPHAVILSCSDSRVPPEVVFDQKLGEVFVIRVAGQSLDNNVIGSIEYAIAHLGTNLVVVMGHESCGAVKATLQALQGADMGSPALNILVNEIKPRVQRYATQAPSKGLLEESWANVGGVAKDLLERSAIMRDAVNSGEVKIIKAMYHLDSGKVDWL